MSDCKTVGLYVHVPFCATKCKYCRFYSVEYNRKAAKEWESAIVHELAQYEQVRYDTVFFGGGTPSLLWREVCGLIPSLPLTPDCEVTVEVNPDDVTPQMLYALSDCGVNRLSVGVQSLDDEVLHFLGRRRDSAAAVRAVELARQAGFRNISADIMLGIPAQTYRDLEAAARLPVNHFSAYMFEYEHTLPDDETAELYLRAVELLPEQYEISNFGVPCKHNLKYWRCEEYIGVGASAHSYYGGKRYANSRGGERYVTEESPGGYEERVMLGLRLTEGIEADCALLERVKAIPAEYVSVNGKNLALTPRGFLIANRIIGELLG